jgi:hypothetical protein
MKVTWTNNKGEPGYFTGRPEQCRGLFKTLVQDAVRGEYEHVLLWDVDGNVVDSWGT